MFAKRTAWDLTPNAMAQRLAALRGAGVAVVDLTESNPTRCGFRYPPELLRSLTNPRGLQYEPSPTGWWPARAAVAASYASRGVTVDPARVVLTAGTSEAYHWVFRLLCDPGDAVLVPTPSYPLFDYLAGLDDVRTIPYPLRDREDRWVLDVEALAQAVTPAVRAVILVHPNNPTGSCVTPEELAAVGRLCRQHRLALVADEVFADYRWPASSAAPASLLGVPDILTFALGGLSKTMGLPQMKLAWLAAGGPAALVQPALARLELISDTYLSVNTVTQQALPAWLASAPAIQTHIRQRVAANRQWVAEHLPSGVTVAPGDGGWSAVLRVSGLVDEERWVLQALTERHVLVHPGYFFEFPAPGYLVLSLLPPPAVFQDGLARLFK